MVHLCLLAAGSGKRFGGNKLLRTLCGVPLWHYGYNVLKQVASFIPAKVHVISRYPEILTFVDSEGVYCADSINGISYTIRSACLACGKTDGNDKILFLAADQPHIRVETVVKLLQVDLSHSEEEDGYLASCTFDGKATGNPVVFSGCLTPKLMGLIGDMGGKAVLREFPERVVKVLCDPLELFDVDTLDDLSNLNNI